MTDLPRLDRWLRFWTVCGMLLCGVGSGAGLFIVLVRIPELTTSRLERLMGTLLGMTVSLLFVVAALLMGLSYLVWRAVRPAAIRARAGSGAAGG